MKYIHLKCCALHKHPVNQSIDLLSAVGNQVRSRDLSRRQNVGTGGYGVGGNTVPSTGGDFLSVSGDPLGMLSTSCSVVFYKPHPLAQVRMTF